MSDSSSGSPSEGDSQNTHTRPERFKRFSKRKNVGHLPSELLQFVKNESYSLLIKGKPGTGKTTFALTLLDNLKDDSNYFYISTRLSLKQLAFYFPWIEKFFSKDDTKSGYRFEDARLDEPESLFERITNQLMDVKSPVILIDTWDTIASFMDRESRLNNERVLQIWRERAGAKLIFLSEAFDLGILDSIVDGVITLENHIVDSTNSRKLTINKLRGVPVQCNTYCYSLYGGVFRSADNISEINLFDKINKTNANTTRVTIKQKDTLFKKSTTKPNLEVTNIFKEDNFINLVVDNKICQELFLSAMIKPLLDWIKIPVNLLMVNNFSNNFRYKCQQILGIHMQTELLNNKVIVQELNFAEPFGIRRDNHSEASFIKYNDGNNLSGQEKINNVPPLLTGFTTKPNELLEKKDNIKILNLMNSDNIQSLLREDYFDKLLRENFTVNVIVHQITSTLDKTFAKDNTWWEMKVEGKNLLLNRMGSNSITYQTIMDTERFLINWYPIQ
ncbi:MAG: gas vesicle protein GvpD P-loop domain-containing protein [Candidatus Nitrosocosmicus sp.]|nr:AAA family ATPase [Candidatus Nitrosocosmicus sp.]